MTLSPGDCCCSARRTVRRGRAPAQRIGIEIDGLGRLDNTLAATAAHDHPMTACRARSHRRRARGAFACTGAIHEATPHAQGLRLADGRVVAEDAVVWLPPFEVGTIIALGLNYADHAKELVDSASRRSRWCS